VRNADLRPIGAYAVRLVEAELRSESLPADSLGPLDLMLFVSQRRQAAASSGS
jgi:hypothetical protein